MEKFKILNGRGSFYQWDFDQKLAVLDDTVTEVHFPLGTDQCPPLPVYDHNGQRVVDVPNILLQTSGMKRIYAFVEDTFGGRTICTEVFRVNERPKPDDYIYTETELWTAEKAVEKALQEAKDSGEFKGDPGPKGDPGVVKFVVVNELPEQDTENAIYLVPVADGAEDNLFDEYIFAEGKWEKIGSAAVAVDLTDYVKKTDYATTSKYGLVKIGSGGGIYLTNGTIYTHLASNSEIDARASSYKVIVPKNIDYAVKVGMTTNAEEWTAEEQTAARDLIGAVGEDGLADYVKNTDYASPSQVGVGKSSSTYGVYCNGSTKYWQTKAADSTEIAAKTDTYKPIVPKYLDLAVKEGICNNSIVLTEEEKAAARAWLGIE